MSKPVIRVKDRGTSYLGEIEVPMHCGRLTIGHVGYSPLSALKRAASTAMRIASDPAIAPFLPPGAMAAIQTARAVTKMSPQAITATIPKMTPGVKAIATKMLQPGKVQPVKRPWGQVSPAAQQRIVRPAQPYPREPADGRPDLPPPPQIDPHNEQDMMAYQAWGPQAFDDQSSARPYGSAPDPFEQYQEGGGGYEEDPYDTVEPQEGDEVVMYEDYFDPAESH